VASSGHGKNSRGGRGRSTELLAFPPELPTRKQVCYLLNRSERDVRELVRLNHFPQVIDGGKLAKYRLEDVRAYIRSLPEKVPTASRGAE